MHVSQNIIVALYAQCKFLTLLDQTLFASYLLTHNPVPVRISHILIGGVVAADGGDVVAAGFGAGDAAVVVVVVEVQGMAFGLGGCVLVGLGGWGGGFCGGGGLF